MVYAGNYIQLSQVIYCQYRRQTRFPKYKDVLSLRTILKCALYFLLKLYIALLGLQGIFLLSIINNLKFYVVSETFNVVKKSSHLTRQDKSCLRLDEYICGFTLYPTIQYCILGLVLFSQQFSQNVRF